MPESGAILLCLKIGEVNGKLKGDLVSQTGAITVLGHHRPVRAAMRTIRSNRIDIKPRPPMPAQKAVRPPDGTVNLAVNTPPAP